MSDQTKALSRIDELGAMHERGTIRRGHIEEMLAGLRRLHEENANLREALQRIVEINVEPGTYSFWFSYAIENARKLIKELS